MTFTEALTAVFVISIVNFIVGFWLGAKAEARYVLSMFKENK